MPVLGTTQGDLEAFYPFNGNANDESGNGNHGTAYGPVLSADRFGNSGHVYYFDGVDDYIVINNSPSLEMGYSDFTIAAWIKTMATEDMARIFSKGSSSCVTGYMLRTAASNSKPFLEISGDDTCRLAFAGSTTVNDNRWHFVVGVVERRTGGKLYVDGELDGTQLADTSGFSLDNARNPMIGYNDTGLWYEPFHGSIDDVRIYSRALSQAEIRELMGTLTALTVRAQPIRRRPIGNLHGDCRIGLGNANGRNHLHGGRRTGRDKPPG